MKVGKAVGTEEVTKSATKISKKTFTSECHTLLEGPTHLEPKEIIIAIRSCENLSGR